MDDFILQHGVRRYMPFSTSLLPPPLLPPLMLSLQTPLFAATLNSLFFTSSLRVGLGLRLGVVVCISPMVCVRDLMRIRMMLDQILLEFCYGDLTELPSGIEGRAANAPPSPL